MASSSWCTPSEYTHFKKVLLAEQEGEPLCFYCHAPVDLKLSPRAGKAFTIDHLKPRALYPKLSKDVKNMVIAHRQCNSAKGTQTAEKARAERAKLERGTRPEWA